MESLALRVETTVSLAPTRLSVSLAILVSTSTQQLTLVKVVLLFILLVSSALQLNVWNVLQELLGMDRIANLVHHYRLAANSVKVLPAFSVSLTTFSMVLPALFANLLVFPVPRIQLVSHALSATISTQETVLSVLVLPALPSQSALLVILANTSTLDLVCLVLLFTLTVCPVQTQLLVWIAVLLFSLTLEDVINVLQVALSAIALLTVSVVT